MSSLWIALSSRSYDVHSSAIAGRLVDAAGLGLDDPVLDLVGHAEAVAATDHVGLVDQRDRVVVPDAVDRDRAALLEADRDVLGVDDDVGVPELHAHDRLDGLERDVEVLEGLGLVGGAPDVGVGGVRLLLAVAVGQVVVDEPLAHLVAAAELGDEVGVEPRLVDAQVGVGEQAVAVEPLDVVALERRAVAPDVDAVLVHRADQHGAGDRAAERRGVEVGARAGADVEGAARDRGQALLDQRAAAVDRAGDLGAVLDRPVGHAADVGLVVLPDVGGVGARDRRPWRASRPRRPRCRALPRTRCRRVRRRGGRSGPCSRGFFLLAVVGVGEGEEPAGEVVAAARVPADHEDGVVAGDGAEDLGELCLVERGGQELGGAGRGAQHDQVGAGVGADEQLAAQPGQPGRRGGGLPRRRGSSVAALGGYGVDERAGRRTDLDGVELDEVARQRGLGDAQPALGEQRRRARPASAPRAG